MRQSRMIAATYLGEQEAAAIQEEQFAGLSEEHPVEWASHTSLLIHRLYLSNKPLSDDDLNLLRRKLGFFGKLAALQSYTLNKDPRADALAGEIRRELWIYAFKFVLAATALLMAGIAGFFLLVIFLAQFLGGKTLRRFDPPISPPHLFLETFTLYLFVALALQALGSILSLSFSFRSMVLSAVMELAVLLLVLYPIRMGIKPTNLMKDIGIVRGSGFGAEAGFGFLSYLAAIPLMAVGIFVTLRIVQLLKIDPATGIHPIVPLLKSPDASRAMIVLIISLAVVMAPVVEEIMFRGFFYRALRARFSVPVAVLLCSALFAGIHPQGIVGFAPLFCIGVVLAVLREWRGSLLAPMIAHACVNGVTLGVLMMM